MAIVRLATFFLRLWICLHSSRLSMHTELLLVNGPPCEQLQQRARRNEPLQLQSCLKIPVSLRLHPLKPFLRHQLKHFRVATPWQHLMRFLVAHLSFHRKDTIHFPRSRKPIVSTDSAAFFAEVRLDVQQQIVCLAFLGCSVLQSRMHPYAICLHQIGSACQSSDYCGFDSGERGRWSGMDA